MKGQKPVNQAYPKELKTLGDHLRKVRLDRSLSQPEVARILNVTADTITGWELNRFEPTAKLAKAIIEFLCYFPFVVDGISLGKQLYFARLVTGKTQREVATVIGCDESSLRYIELDQRKPTTETYAKLTAFITDVLTFQVSL